MTYKMYAQIQIKPATFLRYFFTFTKIKQRQDIHFVCPLAAFYL